MLNYLKKKGNLVHKTAVINWRNLSIGKNNIIGPYVVIGNVPQHPRLKCNGKIIIGNNNHYRQLSKKLHLPTTNKFLIKNDFQTKFFIICPTDLTHKFFLFMRKQ